MARRSLAAAIMHNLMVGGSLAHWGDPLLGRKVADPVPTAAPVVVPVQHSKQKRRALNAEYGARQIKKEIKRQKRAVRELAVEQMARDEFERLKKEQNV